MVVGSGRQAGRQAAGRQAGRWQAGRQAGDLRNCRRCRSATVIRRPQEHDIAAHRRAGAVVQAAGDVHGGTGPQERRRRRAASEHQPVVQRRPADGNGAVSKNWPAAMGAPCAKIGPDRPRRAVRHTTSRPPATAPGRPRRMDRVTSQAVAFHIGETCASPTINHFAAVLEYADPRSADLDVAPTSAKRPMTLVADDVVRLAEQLARWSPLISTKSGWRRRCGRLRRRATR